MARGDSKGKEVADAAQAAAAEALEVSTAAGDAGSAPAVAAASPFGLSSRADYRRAASVPLGWSCLVTNQGAHALTLLLSLFNAASALAVLIGARNSRWSGGGVGGGEFGWIRAGGDTLRAALPRYGLASQIFGALTGAGLIIAAAAALYLTNATLLFFRGWYEAAAAAGGRRAGLPAFAVGSNLLVMAGVFQGLATKGAGASGGRDGKWGFWLTVASGLAWLLKSHILYRSPPPAFVSDVLASVPSGEAASSVRPVIGSLPASLRNSMNRTPGVTVV